MSVGLDATRPSSTCRPTERLPRARRVRQVGGGAISLAVAEDTRQLRVDHFLNKGGKQALEPKLSAACRSRLAWPAAVAAWAKPYYSTLQWSLSLSLGGSLSV